MLVTTKNKKQIDFSCLYFSYWRDHKKDLYRHEIEMQDQARCVEMKYECMTNELKDLARKFIVIFKIHTCRQLLIEIESIVTLATNCLNYMYLPRAATY